MQWIRGNLGTAAGQTPNSGQTKTLLTQERTDDINSPAVFANSEHYGIRPVAFTLYSVRGRAPCLLGAFAGPTQGRTLYCPVTAVHLPTRRIYPSAGSIRWIYPLDLSVGSIRW